MIRYMTDFVLCTQHSLPLQRNLKAALSSVVHGIKKKKICHYPCNHGTETYALFKVYLSVQRSTLCSKCTSQYKNLHCVQSVPLSQKPMLCSKCTSQHRNLHCAQSIPLSTETYTLFKVYLSLLRINL